MKTTWLQLGLTAATLAGLAYFGRQYFDELYQLRHAHIAGIAAMAVIHWVTCVLQAQTLSIALEAYRQPIAWRESFGLTILSLYSNLLFPRSGVGVTAVYLNRVRHVKLLRSACIVLFNAFLFVLSCSAAAFLTVFIDWCWTGQPVEGRLCLLLSVLTLLGWGAVIARWRVPAWYRGPGARLLRRMGRAWKQLGTPAVLWRTSLLHVLMLLLRALRLYAAFVALGIPVDGTGVLLASLLGDLVFVVSFTPTALGLREAVIAFAAYQLGTTPGLALSAALLDRLVFSLTIVLLAQVVVGFVVRAGSGRQSVERTDAPRRGRAIWLGR